MAFLDLLGCQKLISRKIWVTDNSWNFHTVVNKQLLNKSPAEGSRWASWAWYQSWSNIHETVMASWGINYVFVSIIQVMDNWFFIEKHFTNLYITISYNMSTVYRIIFYCEGCWGWRIGWVRLFYKAPSRQICLKNQKMTVLEVFKFIKIVSNVKFAKRYLENFVNFQHCEIGPFPHISTVWEFHNFSMIRILCEIFFGDPRSAKSAILTLLEALNFVFEYCNIPI